MPECPDVEEKWEEIAKSYIPDGIREFQDFPSASLGWMMYIGMAVAKMWDTEWEIYSKIEDLYAYMRDKRGYDAMDEYIREEVLQLQGVDYTVLEKVTPSVGLYIFVAPIGWNSISLVTPTLGGVGSYEVGFYIASAPISSELLMFKLLL